MASDLPEPLKAIEPDLKKIAERVVKRFRKRRPDLEEIEMYLKSITQGEWAIFTMIESDEKGLPDGVTYQILAKVCRAITNPERVRRGKLPIIGIFPQTINKEGLLTVAESLDEEDRANMAFMLNAPRLLRQCLEYIQLLEGTGEKEGGRG